MSDVQTELITPTIETESEATVPAENGTVEAEIQPVEQTVPYSRFREVNESRKADRARIAELEAAVNQRSVQESDAEMRQKFVDFFEGNPAADKFYDISNEMARKHAERMINERTPVTEDSSDPIADEIEALEYSVGHKMSDDDKEALYSAIDELSPKDASGEYTSVVSFDAAYKYMQATRQSPAAPATQRQAPNQARAGIAGLSQPGGGTPRSTGASQEVGFNTWRNRFSED